jgi:methylenetetrahydrofolate dehydrogenase (NADP+)/methenyltetrahydrofolate cyclohydrolase
MSARIIDGKSIAATIREEVKRDVAALRKRGMRPCLAAVLVGDNAASKAYVANKRKTCAEVGIESVLHTPAADLSERALLELICELNDDPNVHGILVQLPLPKHIDERLVIEAISPLKDVDGFHPINLGRLILGLDTFKSCTPAGISELIRRSGYAIESKHVVIIGRSNIVGKPMMNILVQKTKDANATVTVCHSQTRNLASLTRQADILIAAIGRPQFVSSEMVKPGVIVVDVGINRVEDASDPKGYRLVGDVDFESVKNVAAAITPVPGGVGPMTVAMLMVNTVKASKMALEACCAEE